MDSLRKVPLKGLLIVVVLFFIKVPLISAQIFETYVRDGLDVILGSSDTDLIFLRFVFFFLAFIVLYIASNKLFGEKGLGKDEAKKYAIVMSLIIALVATRFITDSWLITLSWLIWLLVIFVILYTVAGYIFKDKKEKFNWPRLITTLVMGLILYLMLGKTGWFTGSIGSRGPIGEIIRVPAYFLFNRVDDYFIWTILGMVGVAGLIALIYGIAGAFGENKEGKGGSKSDNVLKYTVIIVLIGATLGVMTVGGPKILGSLGGVFASIASYWWVLIILLVIGVIVWLFATMFLGGGMILKGLWGAGGKEFILNQPTKELKIIFIKPKKNTKIEANKNYIIRWKSLGGKPRKKFEVFYSINGKDGDYFPVEPRKTVKHSSILGKIVGKPWLVPDKNSNNCFIMVRTIDDDGAETFYSEKFKIEGTKPKEKKLEILAIVPDFKTTPPAFPRGKDTIIKVQVNEEEAEVELGATSGTVSPSKAIAKGKIAIFLYTPAGQNTKVIFKAQAKKNGWKDSPIYSDSFSIGTGTNTFTAWIEMPKTGDILEIGKNTTIKVGAIRGKKPYNFQIQLSRNGKDPSKFAPLKTVSSKTDKAIAINWTPNAPESKNCYIRIIAMDADATKAAEVVTGPFEIRKNIAPPKPPKNFIGFVDKISPKDRIEIGEPLGITYNIRGGEGPYNIQISLSRDGANGTYVPIIPVKTVRSAGPRLTGWKATGPESNDCWLIVRATDSKGNHSEIREFGPFKIINKTTKNMKLEIVEVGSGGNLSVGVPVNIKLNLENAPRSHNVMLFLSKEKGGWERIGWKLVKEGEFTIPWTPKKEGTDKMLIAGTQDPEGGDIYSNEAGPFSILSPGRKNEGSGRTKLNKEIKMGFMRPLPEKVMAGQTIKIGILASIARPSGTEPLEGADVKVRVEHGNATHILRAWKTKRDGRFIFRYHAPSETVKENMTILISTDEDGYNSWNFNLNIQKEDEDIPKPPESEETAKERYLKAYRETVRARKALNAKIGDYIRALKALEGKKEKELAKHKEVMENYVKKTNESKDESEQARLTSLAMAAKKRWERTKTELDEAKAKASMVEKLVREGKIKDISEIKKRTIQKEAEQVSRWMREMMAAAKSLENIMGVEKAGKFIRKEAARIDSEEG